MELDLTRHGNGVVLLLALSGYPVAMASPPRGAGTSLVPLAGAVAAHVAVWSRCASILWVGALRRASLVGSSHIRVPFAGMAK